MRAGTHRRLIVTLAFLTTFNVLVVPRAIEKLLVLL